MATQLDAARLLTLRAAVMKDAGQKTTLESSMAKLMASEVAVRVCDEAVQLHGGYGFIKDYPVEKFYRDVKLCTIGEGTSEIQRVLDGGRISIAALSLGIGRGAFDAARRYVKQRHQFGKAISEFQGIQWKLADMATQLDAARLLTLRAAVMKDAGQKTTLESSMAKLMASEVAVRVCDEAVQLHGGYGFIKDYPVEKFYRDVKLCTIGEGTSEIQRLIIAREILNK